MTRHLLLAAVVVAATAAAPMVDRASELPPLVTGELAPALDFGSEFPIVLAALEDPPPLWRELAEPPAPPPEEPFSSGKGSWYSWLEGRHSWRDSGDRPNSNVLGVPDPAQGVSFYDRSTVGEWFEVRYPNGWVSLEQQTDVGPAPWTGRKIDISAAAAERAGYSPRTFPTDAVIYWRRARPPVDNGDPRAAAVRFKSMRAERDAYAGD